MYFFNESVNATQHTYSKCSRKALLSPTEDKWTQVTIYIIIILFALVGNSLVISIVSRNQRMKNATNYLIVNLSVTELLVTVISMNWTLVAQILHPKAYPYLNKTFASSICKTLSFIDNLTHSLSMLSLTLIAFDRFFAVKFPLKRTITRGRAKKIIAVIWLSSFVASSPMLYAYTARNVGGQIGCFTDWKPLDPSSSLVYIWVHFVVSYALPLCIMVVLYSITVHKLWVRRIPGNVTAANQRLEHQTKMNVLKMCVTVVTLFALSWLPLYVLKVMHIAGALRDKCIPQEIITFSLFLAQSYYAFNPLIYFLFSQDYRRGFLDIIKPLTNLCNHKPLRVSVHRAHVMDMSVSRQTVLTNSGIEAISLRNLDNI